MEARRLKRAKAEGPRGPSRLERALLSRAQVGEESACRALYRHYQGHVFAFLVRMLGDRRTLAEDLLQETFVRVFRSLPRFDPDGTGALSTWILTIAYRLALNALGRRDFVPLTQVELLDSANPESELRRRRLERALVQAVQELAPDHRAVFLLRDYHDLPYEEIATVLGVGVGTVKSRLFRARRNVRAALKELTDA